VVRAKLPQLLLVACVAGAIGLGQGGRLQLAYPVLALAIALWLHRRSTGGYVTFVLWLWMLTPLARRLADWQGGWRDPSLILLTPYLVTAWPAALRLGRGLLALAEVVRVPSRRAAPAHGGLVFGLAAAGAAIGIPFGLITAPNAAIMAGLNWFVPLAFGWSVASAARPDEIERAVIDTFRYAPFVLGVYGMWQFVAPQPWDTAWMINTELTTIGRPVPFEVRVFSTMHSPGVLGSFLFVPLVLWLAQPTIRGLPAACAATIGLVLSQVRTAWLGLAVSAVFVLAALPHRIRARVLVLGAVAALCVTPFLFLPDVADMAAARFATLTEPDSDASALSRLEGHLLAFDFVATRPLGAGLGVGDPRVDQVMSLNDSMLVATLVQFGIVGAFLYFASLCLVLGVLWRYYRNAQTLETTGLACAGLGLLSTAGLAAMTAAAPGVLFWLIGGLAVARQLAPEPVTAPALRLAASRETPWTLAEAPGAGE
jgi:hypothetical protein